MSGATEIYFGSFSLAAASIPDRFVKVDSDEDLRRFVEIRLKQFPQAGQADLAERARNGFLESTDEDFLQRGAVILWDQIDQTLVDIVNRYFSVTEPFQPYDEVEHPFR